MSEAVREDVAVDENGLTVADHMGELGAEMVVEDGDGTAGKKPPDEDGSGSGDEEQPAADGKSEGGDESAEDKGDKSDEPEPEEDGGEDPAAVAAELTAPLTHEEVIESKAGKGLVAEVQAERQRRQELERENAELRKKAAGSGVDVTPDEDMTGAEDAEDDLDDLDDEDVFTRRQVDDIAAARVEAATKPLTERLERLESGAAGRQQETFINSEAADIAALQKEVPEGVKVGAVCKTVRQWLAENDPDLLAAIENKPGFARKLLNWGRANVPEVAAAISKAQRAQDEKEHERLLKDSGGDETEPRDLVDALDDLPD